MARSVFVAKACPASLAPANARCGTVAVPEDYSNPAGRQILLNVIVFGALKPGDGHSAQFDLEGGPGFAVTDSAAFYANDGAMYREHRDLVLADMRGTGGSGALRCPGIEQYEKTNASSPMYPPALVADCAASLAARADLRFYSTAVAARDIDAVREALGYRSVDLNALSYGTTLALRYIADFPDRVRTAVLTGTAPASRTPPRYHAQAAEAGLTGLLQLCQSDPACASAYPDPAADLERSLTRMDATQRAVFLEKLRTLLYSAASARTLPAYLRDAANGAIATPSAATEGRLFADGLYLSITCSESIARMDLQAAIADSDATRFGAYRLQRQRDACANWPLAAADPRLFDQPVSNVPVLFISGALDPVTPTQWTLEVAARFPRSRVVVVPQGAHVLEGLSGLDTCLDRVVPQFVAKGSADDIDMTCFAGMQAPFKTQ
ncbi:MAG TPA: alpha/beta hydrolase [Steroidobacteraceae bacterium]|nr:alpha/beta hydrolase [Steroidobacteraceae bacterium]